MRPDFRERRTGTPASKEWNTRTFGKCSTPRRPDITVIPRSGPSLYSGYFSYHHRPPQRRSPDLDIIARLVQHSAQALFRFLFLLKDFDQHQVERHPDQGSPLGNTVLHPIQPDIPHPLFFIICLPS